MGMREEKQKFLRESYPNTCPKGYLRYFTVKPTEGSRTVFKNTLWSWTKKTAEEKRSLAVQLLDFMGLILLFFFFPSHFVHD